jgi:hypothetical protein
VSGSTHCDNDAVGDITLSVMLVLVGETVSARTVSDSTPFDNGAVREFTLSVTLMSLGGPVSDRSVSGSAPFAKVAGGDIASSVTLLALVLGSVLTTPSCLAISAVSLLTLAFSARVSLFCFLLMDMIRIAQSQCVTTDKYCKRMRLRLLIQ